MMSKTRLVTLIIVVFLLFLPVLLSAATFKLPDTGQTTCYDSAGNVIPCAGTGQDGAYTINPMSFADNGDGTVTDNNTGLVWQKEDDGNLYNWYQASGTFDATYNPTSLDVCGSLNLGDYTDWRLPTKKELISIVDYSIPYPGPAIDTTYFPNTKASYYWSSTTSAYHYPHGAWSVGLEDGDVNDFGSKGYGIYVRCVRGGQYPDRSFVDNNDGTVTDSSTGLMWQQGEPGYMTWSSVLSYCEDLSLGGHSDWRLPSIKELESLTDDTRCYPAIDTNFFPNAYASTYWSSTTHAGYPDHAWLVQFVSGLVFSHYKAYNQFFVRCVRGGQSGSLGDLDNDGLSDDWELQKFGDLVQNPNDDYDHDELTNLQEYQLQTDPTKWDTDGDGVDDGTEVQQGKNPLDPNDQGPYTLTINKSAPENGMIKSSDGGIVCGADCQELYTRGTTVTLTATPSSNAGFLGWSGGGCSGTDQCTITLNTDTTVTANFISIPGPADSITDLIAYPYGDPNDTNDSRIPLILVHGIHQTEDFDEDGTLDEREAVEQPSGWDSFLNFYNGNSDLKNNFKIYLFHYLSDLQSVREIARSLRNHLEAAINKGDINETQYVILAHSMGGLVARSFMQEYDCYNGKKCGRLIKKLITLATPHHGSPGANSTKALDDYISNAGWHFVFSYSQLFYNLISATPGEKWNVTLKSTHPNRSDLRWDAILYPELQSDMNKWLQKLNNNLKANVTQKFILYYGYINPNRADRLRYEKLRNLLPIITSPTVAFYNGHQKLVIASAIMNAGLKRAFPKNDGMVPIQSGALNGYTVAKQVECFDHDHLDMLGVDQEKKCATGKSLLETLKDDLMDIAEE